MTLGADTRQSAFTTATAGRELMTTREVLQYLRVTPRTVYRLIRDGDLPAVRMGGRWRFRRTDIEAWLERQRQVAW
jgi:excisionase family DNA binding protein